MPMNITDSTLLEQLRITDRDIKRRLELLSFTDKDAANLLKYKPLISENIETIVEDFYKNQVEIPEISRLIGDAETLARLKKHMRKYILDIFDGRYLEDYVQSRLRIGMVHKRIGVTPKLYISAIRNLQRLLLHFITLNPEKESKFVNCPACNSEVESLQKIILFDLELVFDTYIHSLMEDVRQSNDDLELYTQSLEETINQRTKDLQLLARKDSLTDLLNQKSFYEELKRELSRNERNRESLVLVYFDLDKFKSINDTDGHVAGDKILTQVSRTIRDNLRPSDIFARYGGDEFCIILPKTNIKNAEEFCNRLITAMKKENLDSRISASFGLAESSTDNNLDADTLVKKSDQAMYTSKQKSGYAISIAP
ncbi:MAG: GGDEF domain-containing protein [Spirochaetia bacterium]|nr:GGDEF domain-containing protein [Spirochaetia bacterium]